MLEDEFVRKISSIQGKAYVVGGWVRDMLRGVRPKDKDYVVTGVTEVDFITLFPHARKVGKAFPVYLLKINGQLCEVAFPRHDDGEGPTFCSLNITIIDDLYRRDTTMNSMAMNLQTLELIDPFHGQDHLQEKRIYPTSQHFVVDPIRAVRVARQGAEFGFTIDESTMEVMNKCRPELLHIPKERLFSELYKALKANQPSLFFLALRQANLLDVIFPQIHALIGQTQPVVYHPEGDAFNHTLEVLDEVAKLNRRVEVRFAALVHDLGKGLTAKDKLPNHHLHDVLGLDALQVFHQHVPLPNRWLVGASFIITNHMRIIKLKQPGKIVDFMLALEQNPLGITGFNDIIFADKGTLVDCLANYTAYMTAIKRVSGTDAPPTLQGKEIGEWIRQRQIREYCEVKARMRSSNW